MKKNKVIGAIIWMLLFALSVFFLLVIPDEYNSKIWVALMFDIIVFISQLFLWISFLEKNSQGQSFFLKIPELMFSSIYMGIQIIICILTAILKDFLSMKVVIVINFILFIVFWIVLLLLIISKDNAIRVDSQQKDHHIQL